MLNRDAGSSAVRADLQRQATGHPGFLMTEPNNQAAGLNTTYTYDARGRVKTITYPATSTQPATTMQYTYDGAVS